MTGILGDARGGFPKGSLPYLDPHLLTPVTPWDKDELGKCAAVSVLFIPPASSCSSYSRLVLTVRSVDVGTHKGQIAFAGGRADIGDVSPLHTARRELFEEVGLSEFAIQCFGILPAIAALDGSRIVPVLMSADVDESHFKLNMDEVADLIFVPWNLLTSENNKRFSFNLFGNRRESDQFVYKKHCIWGLTARIIADLQLSG